MSNYESLGGYENTRPTLFDVGLYIFCTVCPIFFLLPLDIYLAQRLFFVFGVFVLFGLGFLSKGRNFRSKTISFLIIWSLSVCLFHAFKYILLKPGSYIFAFLNFAVLFDGAIYILCGCMLYSLVIKHSSKFNIGYPILVINILNFIFAISQKVGWNWVFKNIDQINQISISGLMGTRSQLVVFSALSIPILWRLWKPLALICIINIWVGNSFTGVVAFIIASLIYILVKRDWLKVSIVFLLVIFSLFYVKWEKFNIRTITWSYGIQKVIESPVIGHGFSKGLTNNKIVVYNDGVRETTYIHNDYLNIAKDLGLPFLIVFLIGFFKIIIFSKKDFLWFSILILAISCFNQTNFYFVNIAVIGIILLALKKKEILCTME